MDRADRLLRALDEHTGLTVEEAAEAVDLPRRHVAMLLVRLGADGLAIPEGRRWFATDLARSRDFRG